MEKKLYKSSADKKLCGVCAGIADYFNIDPTIVRLIVAEVAFFTAIVPAIVIYLIVSLVVPNEPQGYVAVENTASKKMYKGHEKKIAGVCSGIAEYLNIDSTIVRLVLVLLFLIFGNGLYTYLLLWWILPVAPDMQENFGPQQYYNDPNANYYNPNQNYNNQPNNGYTQNPYNAQPQNQHNEQSQNFDPNNQQ